MTNSIRAFDESSHTGARVRQYCARRVGQWDRWERFPWHFCNNIESLAIKGVVGYEHPSKVVMDEVARSGYSPFEAFAEALFYFFD